MHQQALRPLVRLLLTTLCLLPALACDDAATAGGGGPPVEPDSGAPVCVAGAPCERTDREGPCAIGETVCTLTGTQCETPAPSDERCDGVDNDCDGRLDEDIPGTGELCPEVGEDDPCRPSGLTACDPELGMVVCDITETGTPGDIERCNREDDDCDGTVDEGFEELGEPCTVGLGACAVEAVYGCSVDTTALVCLAMAGLPGDETCNAVDDDCDGVIDEGITDTCYEGPQGTAGVGICRAGAARCVAGAFSACEGQAVPGDEACNGLDDDCDGTTDEGDGRPLDASCYTGPEGTEGVGICRAGAAACVDGAPGVCRDQVLPGVEICDGVDNDCNGRVDDVDPVAQPEGCGCDAGETRPCYPDDPATRGVGRCRDGTQSCGPGGGFGVCQGAVRPTLEVCDGVDEDCDGRVDEDIDEVGAPCINGEGICAANGAFACRPAQGGLRCDAVQGQPRVERCNDQDDDCDGAVDEDFGLDRRPARAASAPARRRARRGVRPTARCAATRSPACLRPSAVMPSTTTATAAPTRGSTSAPTASTASAPAACPVGSSATPTARRAARRAGCPASRSPSAATGRTTTAMARSTKASTPARSAPSGKGSAPATAASSAGSTGRARSVMPSPARPPAVRDLRRRGR
ncbi:MAG: hypothetical protein H6701_01835 [Myxococcales bacterium]|nr:hypothetical protein [Myxococcales bacterium]